MTAYYDECAIAAKSIVEKVGKHIVMGVPLGLGKPIGLLNALYRLVEADASLQLTIITGLTLSRPILHSELEKRFIEPIIERLLKDYEDPLYERARELQQLPANIHVIEFFLSPGRYLHNAYVQQHYINSTYTHVVEDTLHYNINVIAQLVSASEKESEHYSLSCNTDLFKDVAHQLRHKKARGEAIAIVAEVNPRLPFMYNDALIRKDDFTHILDAKPYRALFALPHDELSPQDHLIGLYTSCLIKDEGCLQIGIGKLSNAVANALIMRHTANADYQQLLQRLSIQEKFGEVLAKWGDTSPFVTGLYASTEMVSDEYMALYQQSILKKRVYDHVGLQRLLNEKKISEKITPETLDVLLENALIHPTLTAHDVAFLQAFGIFLANLCYEEGGLRLASGEVISADLSLPVVRQQIVQQCLGKELTSGKIIHAGFFLGTEKLYDTLNRLPFSQLQQIDMTSVARTNRLDWWPELLSLQRKEARFINSAMMVTVGGTVISDGIDNVVEVSGVGGQFDFVVMARQLEKGVSIINCRSTRETKEGVQSNVLWNYGSMTIPRYLRDIVITEYGIADCRSKTDAEVIKAMLAITDSRFQASLLAAAKKAGKLPQDYVIPLAFQQNYPAVIEKIVTDLQSQGYCQPYPFGSDLTEEEQTLQRALLCLKKASTMKRMYWLMGSLFLSPSRFRRYLARMQLATVHSMKAFIYQRLLLRALYLTNAAM